MSWFRVTPAVRDCTAERGGEYRRADDTQQKRKRIISARNTIALIRGTPIAENTNRARKEKDFAD
jgi:hypothetical protein